MKKLISWFYTTKLGQWWLEKQALKKHKELEATLNGLTVKENVSLYFDSTQHKYQEGISNVKRKINDEVKIKNFENYNLSLKNKELIELAKDETVEQANFRRMMEKIFVHKDVDVKDQVEKFEMIEKRIDDFYELQRYNEERQLLKNIRSAKRKGDLQLAERLTNDWKQKFRYTVH